MAKAFAVLVTATSVQRSKSEEANSAKVQKNEAIASRNLLSLPREGRASLQPCVFYIFAVKSDELAR